MTMTDIDLDPAADAAIRELASASYPDEGCGVLLGSFGEERMRVVVATRGTNLNTERSRDRYVLDPSDIVRADREARDRALDIVGFWHSHPDHPARPSQFDTDHAWMDYVYVIVATSSAGAGDLNGFMLTEEGGPFEQLMLSIAAGGGGR